MAFLFISFVALILAGLFTIVGVIGWKLVKPSLAKPQKAPTAQTGKKPTKTKTNTTAPVTQPPVRPEQPEAPHPVIPTPPAEPENRAALPTEPRARFKMGLKQCLSRPPESYPCAWQDTQSGVVKQFKIDKYGEPMVRRVFDMGGKLLSLTSLNTQHQYIIMHRDEQNINWFLDRQGIVRQIARPAKSNTDLQDYYYYMVNGQLNACLCADKTTACCQEAPRLDGKNHYCQLFPLDEEFCVSK